MLACVVEIQVHLARIGVGELPDFQVDDDQAPQTPMEEKEINSIPGITYAEPALAPDEGEIATELKEKGLQFGDQRRLELSLSRILILQAQELQNERILDLPLQPERNPPVLDRAPFVSIAILFVDMSARS